MAVGDYIVLADQDPHALGEIGTYEENLTAVDKAFYQRRRGPTFDASDRQQ